jgi:hypothetical protein
MEGLEPAAGEVQDADGGIPGPDQPRTMIGQPLEDAIKGKLRREQQSNLNQRLEPVF